MSNPVHKLLKYIGKESVIVFLYVVNSFYVFFNDSSFKSYGLSLLIYLVSCCIVCCSS